MLSFEGGLNAGTDTASTSVVAGPTKAFVNTWAKDHIDVNAIAPDYIATSNMAALLADETRDPQIIERFPGGRSSKPEDIARFIGSLPEGRHLEHAPDCGVKHGPNCGVTLGALTLTTPGDTSMATAPAYAIRIPAFSPRLVKRAYQFWTLQLLARRYNIKATFFLRPA